MKIILIVFVFLNLMVCAYADNESAIDLLFFKTQTQSMTFVLPRRSNETPEMALQRYKQVIDSQNQLKNLFTEEQLGSFNIKQIIDIEQYQRLSGRSSLLVLANRANDQAEQVNNPQLRIKKFSAHLKDKNNLFILPIAAAAGLSAAEEAQFHQRLVALMNGVLALGGNDVAPLIYDEPLLQSEDVNLERDRYEISFIKAWIESKKGMLFGVCRGHQLISAALGFKLIQHIENHGYKKWSEHLIKLQKTTLNRLQNLFDSNEIVVNSYHHQAVIDNGNPAFEVAAYAEDGTVEALESKDGLIMTMQFHPEFMNSRVSKKIFQLMNSMLNSKYRYPGRFRCEHLF